MENRKLSTKEQSPQLLAAELRVIADGHPSRYCRDILYEAASRLEDTNKIATFFRNKVVAIMEGEYGDTE